MSDDYIAKRPANEFEMEIAVESQARLRKQPTYVSMWDNHVLSSTKIKNALREIERLNNQKGAKKKNELKKVIDDINVLSRETLKELDTFQKSIWDVAFFAGKEFADLKREKIETMKAVAKKAKAPKAAKPELKAKTKAAPAKAKVKKATKKG